MSFEVIDQKPKSANLFLYTLPFGALCLFPFVKFSDKTMLAWVALLSIAVLSTYIANYCYYQGLKKLEPVVASVFAYVFLREYFTPLGYLGAVLIVTAVIATIYEK